MTKVELVARAIAGSRTGELDGWGRFRADALRVLAAFGEADARLCGPQSGKVMRRPANDR